MKKWILLLVFILWGGINMLGNAASSTVHANLYAVTDVSLIPMDREEILLDQTVLISNGAISTFGPSSQVQIPNNAEIIDGSGKFLLPGLIDMHTHVCDANDLPLLLAHGVTTIRNMGDLPGWVKFSFGYADILKLRKKVSTGEIIGPDIYTAGPILDGAPPVSPFNSVVINAREAEQAVVKQKKQGYDFIKIYDGLSPDTLNGIMKAAQKYQMPVAGHIPKQIGIEHALELGLTSIEHLTGYLDNDQAAFIIPENQLEQYAEKTKLSGVWNCPTLVIWDHLVPREEFAKITNLPEMQYVSWRVEWLWKQTLKQVFKVNYNGPDYPGHMMEISKKMTAALHRAGAPLILGTDMNFVGVFPGWATQRELELLVEAGLTPYEALQTGTANAAACLEQMGKFGTVTVGKRANLLLVDENPLADIKNIRKIHGVFLRGQWYPISDIRKQIKKQ